MLRGHTLIVSIRESCGIGQSVKHSLDSHRLSAGATPLASVAF